MRTLLLQFSFSQCVRRETDILRIWGCVSALFIQPSAKTSSALVQFRVNRLVARAGGGSMIVILGHVRRRYSINWSVRSVPSPKENTWMRDVGRRAHVAQNDRHCCCCCCSYILHSEKRSIFWYPTVTAATSRSPTKTDVGASFVDSCH